MITLLSYMYVLQSSIDIGALNTLTNLEYLDLTGNRISSPENMNSITHMRKLKQLKLSGNPITLRANFPACVWALNPSLCFIDEW